ncbi:MAG: 2-amino-4-hydroxy-6-hydroxymethyldihydropteridine diphosphokinase [Thermoplasmata archaeon]|jgi:uncharacterized Rossmann fold enzyme|nr:2-amino-4-hydroxy-6-hydroxymethyldihydropteridine diphosphokinase [Thermoplasmata archaeon]
MTSTADWDAIRAEFGYDEAADRAAALELKAALRPQHWRMLGVELRNRRNVAVLGCGPSLDQVPASQLAGKVVVAADGACTWLRQQGLVPHVVVTDLDGAPEDLAWAAQAGAHMVVHAHGDNRTRIRDLAPKLAAGYGTHQVEPTPELEPLRNLGGFTDGDRAVLLCEAVGALEVRLFGFDFDRLPGPYSHDWDPTTKPRKLAWAERIVAACAARGRMRVVRWMP